MVAFNVTVLHELAPARHALVDRVRDHGAQEPERPPAASVARKCSPCRLYFSLHFRQNQARMQRDKLDDWVVGI
jgi:hypothetical protein